MDTFIFSNHKKNTKQRIWRFSLTVLMISAICVNALGSFSPAFAQTTHTISGNVEIQGVLVSYDGDGGSESGSVFSGVGGNYSFDVSDGWDGEVTPSLAGYLFFPTSTLYFDVSGDLSDQDYVAVPITYAISGKITGVVVEDVLLTYYDGGTRT